MNCGGVWMASPALQTDYYTMQLSESERTVMQTDASSFDDLLAPQIDNMSQNPERYSIRGVILRSKMPSGLANSAEALASLLALPEGWDSGNAKRIDRGIIIAALNFLSLVLTEETSRPIVVPTLKGVVQLEWHTDAVDLEITFYSSFRAEVYVWDAATGEEWEGSL